MTEDETGSAAQTQDGREITPARPAKRDDDKMALYVALAFGVLVIGMPAGETYLGSETLAVLLAGTAWVGIMLLGARREGVF